MATKREQLQAELDKLKAELTFAVEQDEKDFVQEEIDEVQKKLDALKGEEESGKKKAEPKKSEAKPKKEAKEPKESKETPAPKKSDVDCEDLEKVADKASKAGYDIDEVISSTIERKKKAKLAAEKRAQEPKKTPATKNKEAIEKTSEKVVKSVEKRAEKGDVSREEIERLISKYEEAIEELRGMLSKVKKGKGGKAGSITKADVQKKMDEANKLFQGHISNDGTLDYSEKEYGYLNDEIEDVQVGFFKDEDLDSDYAERLREEGFELTAEEAYNILSHRIDSINEELEEGKYSKGGKTGGKRYAKGGEVIMEGHFN
jgi:hypothetical protein